jgi:hypothetical protein
MGAIDLAFKTRILVTQHDAPFAIGTRRPRQRRELCARRVSTSEPCPAFRNYARKETRQDESRWLASSAWRGTNPLSVAALRRTPRHPDH